MQESGLVDPPKPTHLRLVPRFVTRGSAQTQKPNAKVHGHNARPHQATTRRPKPKKCPQRMPSFDFRNVINKLDFAALDAQDTRDEPDEARIRHEPTAKHNWL